VRKPPASPQARDTIAKPHPLAEQLIARLEASSGVRVLDYASGSGRNTAALRGVGLKVVAIDDERAASPAALADVDEAFDAVLSTHGLLHGDVAAIAATLHWIADHLKMDGLLYATFGSSRDARFGRGTRIGASTFAPIAGNERGVPHSCFDEPQLRALLAAEFDVESLQERDVDEVVGSWAHRKRALRGAVHWFIVARKCQRSGSTLA
jgi:protein-L-isoaspartate O-methyltransferase